MTIIFYVALSLAGSFITDQSDALFSSVMMTSSNGNIFRVTGPWCGEFTGDRWIPRTIKGQWRGALRFSLICAWINGWVKNHKAGDLRCHRAHYDVTIMFYISQHIVCQNVLNLCCSNMQHFMVASSTIAYMTNGRMQPTSISSVLTLSVPRQQRPSDGHRSDIDPTRKCLIDVWSMAIQ